VTHLVHGDRYAAVGRATTLAPGVGIAAENREVAGAAVRAQPGRRDRVRLHVKRQRVHHSGRGHLSSNLFARRTIIIKPKFILVGPMLVPAAAGGAGCGGRGEATWLVSVVNVVNPGGPDYFR
jgi:hypothetical protein